MWISRRYYLNEFHTQLKVLHGFELSVVEGCIGPETSITRGIGDEGVLRMYRPDTSGVVMIIDANRLP